MIWHHYIKCDISLLKNAISLCKNKTYVCQIVTYVGISYLPVGM